MNRPPDDDWRRSGNGGIPPKIIPDHGHHFVPGGESAPNRAPQSLDHFKRGYRERTDQRERETEYLTFDSDHHHRSSVASASSDFGYPRGTTGASPPRDSGRFSHRSSGGDRPSYSSYDGRDSQSSNRGSFHGGGGGGDHRRSFNGGDRGDDRGGGGRGHVIMGLDVQSLVDRLCRRDVDAIRELDTARENHIAVFQSGKAVTAIISNLARRRNLRLASSVWEWIDSVGIVKNTFHYNSMISVCEKVRDYKKALRLLDEMKEKGVTKNEVTFSSAISACEKCGQWRTALDLLDRMKREGTGQTAIAYNAAISACEKGLVPNKALEIFEQMKREGVRPTVVTYSALISAAEKGQQWKLALEILEEMKAAGHGANVIAYSAAISALSKGQMWHKALELFREIEATGGKPSIVTYNATMTALEKGLQWERALDLFDEMKKKNMPVTVVSYGSSISACEKGLQYRQCLEYLDEMTEMGIKKNVIIFGAAMSCMEKSCRADIAFQLMERMKIEGVAPNVHIYNSAISACARCNLWDRGYQLFQEMEKVGVPRDVVTYNAVLDAVCSQVELGRRLFREGVEKGFYSRVSRLGTQWLELDLHFLSLGGGEIALGWWFEECLVPYLVNKSKLKAVQSISIVTGYGKTRLRGARMNDDGMRLRVKAMLKYMNITEMPQPNKGRIHIDKVELISEVKKNGGRIRFDVGAYTKFKEEETTANKYPDVPQKIRARFRPAKPGEGPPGALIREGADEEPPSYSHDSRIDPPRKTDAYPQEGRDGRRSSYISDERIPRSSWQQDNRATYSDRNPNQRGGGYGDERRGEERRGSYDVPARLSSIREEDSRGYTSFQDRRMGHNESMVTTNSYTDADRRGHRSDPPDSRGWEPRGSYEREHRPSYVERDRYDDRGDDLPPPRNLKRPSSHRDPYDRDNRDADQNRSPGRDYAVVDRRGGDRDFDMPNRQPGRTFSDFSAQAGERFVKRQRHSFHAGESEHQAARHHEPRQKRAIDSVLYMNRGGISSAAMKEFSSIDEENPNPFKEDLDDPLVRHANGRQPDASENQNPSSGRGYSIATANRGYSIEPTYPNKRGA